MANIKSSIKRISITEKKSIKNQKIRSRTRTIVKKLNLAVLENDKGLAEKELINAIKAIDQAASKGIIHKNKAARNKSQLVKKVSAM